MTWFVFCLGLVVAWQAYAIMKLRGHLATLVRECQSDHDTTNVLDKTVITSNSVISCVDGRLGRLEAVVYGTVMDNGKGELVLCGGLTHKIDANTRRLSEVNDTANRALDSLDKLRNALGDPV